MPVKEEGERICKYHMIYLLVCIFSDQVVLWS